VGSGFCFRDSNRRSLRPKISSAMVANIHKVAVRKTSREIHGINILSPPVGGTEGENDHDR
jgi:hypothetical protein